jgi:CheY-like chemotaxis protein
MKQGDKILLIEDVKIAQMVAAENIRELGFEVDTADSGKAALTLLKKEEKEKYLLVFMDLGLPDTDGFELTQEIRQSDLLDKAVPIIALTAHHEKSYQEKASQYGLDDFLMKPLTIEKAKTLLKKFKLLSKLKWIKA